MRRLLSAINPTARSSPLSVASFRPGGKVIPVYADGDDESQVLARLEDMRRLEDQRSAASRSSRKSRGVHAVADEEVAAVEDQRSTASSGRKSRDTPSSFLEDQRSAVASWSSRKSHGVHAADDEEVAAVEDQRSTASSGLKSRDAPSTRSVSSSSFRHPGGKIIPVYADDDNEEAASQRTAKTKDMTVASSYASKATPGGRWFSGRNERQVRQEENEEANVARHVLQEIRRRFGKSC